jgi:GTP-binding protein YchF
MFRTGAAATIEFILKGIIGRIMQVGIIGLPSSGKTSVFNAISGGTAEVHAFSGGGKDAEPNLAVVPVPDERQEWLNGLYKPKKSTYATVELVDVSGVMPGQAAKDGFSPQMLTNLRQVDALVHVVRSFENASVPHPSDTVDAKRDAELLELELILADLSVVEKRIGKLDAEIGRKKGPERNQLEAEKELMQEFHNDLMNEKPLRQRVLSDDQWKLIRGFTFLSQKPLLVVANISESEIGKDDTATLAALRPFCSAKGMPLVAFCGKTEMEIGQLAEAERADFLAAMGIEETGRDKLVKEVYALLRLIAFFTVGEDEVKAWTITRGTVAQEAARKIHSDIARGFIRAEVAPFDALKQLGSWNAAKDKGQIRLEGKEYLVNDGDCINFRFAV